MPIAHNTYTYTYIYIYIYILDATRCRLVDFNFQVVLGQLVTDFGLVAIQATLGSTSMRYTTVCLWCNGHFTNINAYRV